MQNRIECGTYRVFESKIYHYAGYECAAWWKDVRVEAGDYPVFGCLDASGLRFFVNLPGVIVADNFQSLFGGGAFGICYDEMMNAGKPDTFAIDSQDYLVFESLKDGGKSPWKINLHALPLELDTCSDCKGVIKKHPTVTRCPGCAVKRFEQRRDHARGRHRFLLATGYGLRTSCNSAYLDSTIAQANSDQSQMHDFYRKRLRDEISAMRAAGPRRRIAARQRYPVPSYAFPAR